MNLGHKKGSALASRPTTAHGFSLRPRFRELAVRVTARFPAALRRPLRRLYVTLLRWRPNHPEIESTFSRMLTSGSVTSLRALRAAAGGPRILLATNIGSWQHGMTLDSVLGAALTLRGARVDFMQCDALLPACQAMEIGVVSPAKLASGERPYICASCTAQGRSLFNIVGLPRLAMSELIDEGTRKSIRARAAALTAEEIARFTADGIDMGEHAIAGALRFFARGDLSDEPEGEGVLRRYAEGAMLTAAAIEQAIARNRYDVVIAHHGIYVPQGIVNEVCRRRGVRLVAWNPAYRRHCFIFSHADTYHRTMIAEPNAAWETIVWSPRLERDTLDYLDSRWDGSEDWIRFHTDPQHDMAAIAGELGLDASKPIVTLLTNVVWDAQLHYPSNAFPSMLDWVFDTIRYFAKRPDLQLVIRVHPAELTGFMPSRQHMADEVARAFPNLPGNVRIVAPSSSVSTYTLCDNSTAVLIYNTKAGIEVTAKGIPTVVAGDAWIRNKGFCESPTTAAEYFAVLDRLPFGQRMDESQRKRALRYAYHLFFRRMIPLPFIEARERGRLSLDLDALDDLAPGRYPGLDVICDGILTGSPFIYPAESLSGMAAAQRQASAVA
jgi:hypothetical protein